MPSGVFKPYASVATAVLVFQKGGSTKSVWFYEMTSDGFSLSDKRSPVAENDIPDILQRWPSREEGVHSFKVKREELAKHGDALTPGRYRELHAEVADHDAPAEIIDDILKTEEQIAEKLHVLRKQLAQK